MSAFFHLDVMLRPTLTGWIQYKKDGAIVDFHFVNVKGMWIQKREWFKVEQMPKEKIKKKINYKNISNFL